MTTESTPAVAPSAGTPFAQACVEAVRVLIAQQTDGLDSKDDALLSGSLSLIVATLPRLLIPRVNGGIHDAQDVAQEALARFMRAVQIGQVSPDMSPSGYLLTIAVNVIRDRRRRPPLPLPATDFVLEASNESGDDVEAVAKLLDEMASLGEVRAALAHASGVEDRLVLEVVTAWLDLAARVSAAPSTREVALTLGIGKSSVANALNRFRGYVTTVRKS